MTDTERAELTELDPVPLLKGKFAVYETPAGGVHLVVRSDEDTEDRHVEVPPYLVKLAKGGKSPFSMFGKGK